jgi:hypothetical protein
MTEQPTRKPAESRDSASSEASSIELLYRLVRELPLAEALRYACCSTVEA